MPDTGCNGCDNWPGSPSYPCPIPQVADGDAVSAANANAPISSLSSRTEYLRCFLESLEVGTAHYVRNVVLHSEVVLGDVVYYDSTTSSYRKAYIHIEGRDVYDNESCDTYTLDSSIADSSYPFGVVVEVGTDSVVCINGQFSTYMYDNPGTTLINNLLAGFSAFTDEAPKIGQMYLSTTSADAGKVSKTKPPLGVPVCFITPDLDNSGSTSHYLITVKTNLHDLMQAHRHYSFRLTNEPAVNFPIGYSNHSTAGHSAGDAAWVADTTELDIYLYGIDNTTSCTIGSTDPDLVHVGTATYAGEDGINSYGCMIHSFIGNENYVQMIEESGVCHGTLTPFESFLKVWDRRGKAVVLGDDILTATTYVDIFNSDSSPGVDALTILEGAGEAPLYRYVDSTLSVTYRINTNYQNTSLPGWLYCDSISCSAGGPGEGGRYYYNIDGDSTLSAVWPPYPVQSSILYISGTAPHTSQIVIDNEGIFWFDNTEDGAPFSHRFPEVNSPEGTEWAISYNGSILSKEALLYYTILASKTDDASVQTLNAKDGSVITVTNPDGEDADTGHLVIGADFTIDEDTTAEGALVVKDFDGFTLKKGNVVEKITSGPLIDVESTIIGGQGTVKISMADFAGVREGEPDMLFADDILLERYQDIFYKVFPPGRSSSITGKIFIPSFLPTSNSELYTVDVLVQFLLPDGGTPPSPITTYKVVDTTITTTYATSGTGNINSGITTPAGSPNTLSSLGIDTAYDYEVKSVLAAPVAVTPGDLFIFKTALTSATNDPKLAILDVRYNINTAQ